MYESDKKPPVFCAACELGGCVVLLGKFLSLSSMTAKANTRTMHQYFAHTEKGCSSTFTEKELLDEMKANEISEEDYQVLVDRLKNDVFRIGYYN